MHVRQIIEADLSEQMVHVGRRWDATDDLGIVRDAESITCDSNTEELAGQWQVVVVLPQCLDDSEEDRVACPVLHGPGDRIDEGKRYIALRQIDLDRVTVAVHEGKDFVCPFDEDDHFHVSAPHGGEVDGADLLDSGDIVGIGDDGVDFRLRHGHGGLHDRKRGRGKKRLSDHTITETARYDARRLSDRDQRKGRGY